MKPSKKAPDKTAQTSPKNEVTAFALAHLAISLIAGGVDEDAALKRSYALLRSAQSFLDRIASEEYTAEQAKHMRLNLDGLCDLLGVKDRRQARKWTIAGLGQTAGVAIWKRMLHGERLPLDTWIKIKSAHTAAVTKGKKGGPIVRHGAILNFPEKPS